MIVIYLDSYLVNFGDGSTITEEKSTHVFFH